MVSADNVALVTKLIWHLQQKLKQVEQEQEKHKTLVAFKRKTLDRSVKTFGL